MTDKKCFVESECLTYSLVHLLVSSGLIINSSVFFMGHQSMIKGVKDIYYNVANMERAVEFSRNVLGMKLIVSSPFGTALEIGGVQIGLHWSGGNSIPAVPFDGHGAHAGGTLTLHSNDILEDTKRLLEGGAEIVGKLDEEWGQLTVFKDPDGNILKLMEPV